MKTILTSLFLGLQLLVSAAVSTDCRHFLATADPELPLSEQVRMDLLNGIWVSGQTQDEATFYFLDFDTDSMADLVGATANGQPGYQRIAWSVANSTDGVELLLFFPGTLHPEAFLIRQHCEGIELTHQVTGARTDLKYLPDNPGQLAVQRRADLTGAWTITLNAKDLSFETPEQKHIARGVFRITYDFQADGTFIRRLTGADPDLQLETTGAWEISPDGNYLFLSLSTGGKECALIKYLQTDEMVLQHKIAFSSPNVNIDRESFFLNKR